MGVSVDIWVIAYRDLSGDGKTFLLFDIIYPSSSRSNLMETYDELFWVVLVGESFVGKSCILSSFREKVFNSKYVPTIGELLLLLFNYNYIQLSIL